MMLNPNVVAVPQRRFTPAFTMSVAVHAAAALAVMLVVQSRISRITDPPPQLLEPVVWLPDLRPPSMGGGGAPAPPKPRPIETPVTTVPEPVPIVVEEPPSIAAEPETRAVEAIAAPGPPAVGADPSARGGGGTEGGAPGPGNGPGPGGGGTVYQGGNGVSWPVATRRPPPIYTAEAMRARLQGTVFLKCIVRPDGACSDIRVVRSLDSKMGLDEKAIESAKQWRFRPGMRQGEPVPVEIDMAIEFNIR